MCIIIHTVRAAAAADADAAGDAFFQECAAHRILLCFCSSFVRARLCWILVFVYIFFVPYC